MGPNPSIPDETVIQRDFLSLPDEAQGECIHFRIPTNFECELLLWGLHGKIQSNPYHLSPHERELIRTKFPVALPIIGLGSIDAYRRKQSRFIQDPTNGPFIFNELTAPEREDNCLTFMYFGPPTFLTYSHRTHHVDAFIDLRFGEGVRFTRDYAKAAFTLLDYNVDLITEWLRDPYKSTIPQIALVDFGTWLNLDPPSPKTPKRFKFLGKRFIRQASSQTPVPTHPANASTLKSDSIADRNKSPDA